MSAPSSASIEVEIFSDVVCPWCFIGITRLRSALLATGTEATIRYRPFLLDPDTPEEGKDIRAMLREKYGADPAAMFTRVEGEARKSGLALDLKRQPRSYPTVRAHTLLRHAEARGTQVALADALFDANFHQGLNIHDVDVLTELASRHGFEAAEARALLLDKDEHAATEREAMQASAMGIRGVPFFVFGGRLALSGAQPDAVFQDALREAQEELGAAVQ